MPGVILLIAVVVLTLIGLSMRPSSPVIGNAAFILAAVLLVLAVMAFFGWA